MIAANRIRQCPDHARPVVGPGTSVTLEEEVFVKLTAFAMFCAAPLFLSLGGCGKDAPVTPPAPLEVYSIHVQPASLVLQAGGSAQLAGQADDVRGETVGGASFSFASADQRIAGVTATGRVTAPGPAGRTEIRITSGGRVAQVPVVVKAGPAAHVDVLEAPAAQSAAGASLGTVRVRILDAHGNGLGDRPLAWRITRGDGTLIDAMARTGADGSATATWQAGTTTGPQALELSSAGLEPALFTALAHAGAAAQLTLRLAGSDDDEPPGVTAGQPSPLVASVHDAHGNGVARAEVVLDPVADCGFDGGRPTTGETGTTPLVPWTPRARAACRITARVDATEITVTLNVRIGKPRPARRR